MSKNRVFKPIASPVDEATIKTLNRPLKGFPNHSITVQGVFSDGQMDSKVDISNLDPVQQMEGGFRMIELLCNHLAQALQPKIPNITDPVYRLLQTGVKKYKEIKQQAEEAIKSISD